MLRWSRGERAVGGGGYEKEYVRSMQRPQVEGGMSSLFPARATGGSKHETPTLKLFQLNTLYII